MDDKQSSMHKLDLIKLYSKKRALVVDEFPDMRASIRRMLRSFGVEIIELANDGSEAMLRCRENEYDIIICDYNLGSGKNGQQILEELRYTNNLKHHAIYILITAETTRSMVFGALEYKPDDYLTKPFTQAVLQSRLDKIVLENLFFMPVYEALDSGEYTQAAQLAGKLALEYKRYRMQALKLEGQAWLKQGAFDKALKLYSDILQARRQEWACIGCARALMGLNKFTAARTILAELIEHGSESLDVFDCISEAEIALGRNGVAQSMLERATLASPLGILRQIRLAEVAMINNDYLTAEKAYRRVIKLGINSCYDSHENALGLTRCLLAKERHQTSGSADTIKECHTVFAKVKKKYSGDEPIKLQTDLVEVKALAQEGEIELATENCNKLYEAYLQMEDVSPQLGMDMAAAFIGIDESQLGRGVLEDLAERFADDPKVLAKIDAMADEPISNAAKANAAKINLDGKALFEKGDFEKAIQLFRRAVTRYPNNVALKLNLVLAMFKFTKNAKAKAPQKDAANGLDTAGVIVKAQDLLASLDITAEHGAFKRYKSLEKEFRKLKQAA